MTHRTAETSPLVYTRVAGLLYLIIAVCGFFSMMYIPSTILVPGDATATANNIVSSESLFRIGIVSDSVLFLSEIVLVAILYVLLKPVSTTLSLIAALSRLAMSVIQGINLLYNLTALLLLSGADYLKVFEADQLHGLVLLFLNAHSYGVLVWGASFGLHLLVLGYLLFKSRYVPRLLGVLLAINSLGYLTQSFGNILLPNYEAMVSTMSRVFLGPGTIGELALIFWLLLKGVNVPKSDGRAPASP
jgi:hypothetical protein